MKSNSVTRGLAIGLLVVYLLWSLFSLPFTNILVSASIGLISYGSTESLEISSVVTILIGVMFYTYRRSWYTTEEGFEANDLSVSIPGGPAFESGRQMGVTNNASASEGPMPIVKLVDELQKKHIKGMLSANYMEGFADAGAINNPVPDAGSETGDKKKEDAAVPSSTAPAPVKDATALSETLKSQLPGGKAIETFAKDGNGPENTGLFRLGALPTDKAGGPHIDASTTLMTALNALKPDQIKAMTDDTQKLMETQKNLMGMLGAMKPMLQDGKQMMETFGTLFNK
jgi:hypothetical protein